MYILLRMRILGVHQQPELNTSNNNGSVSTTIFLTSLRAYFSLLHTLSICLHFVFRLIVKIVSERVCVRCVARLKYQFPFGWFVGHLISFYFGPFPRRFNSRCKEIERKKWLKYWKKFTSIYFRKCELWCGIQINQNQPWKCFDIATRELDEVVHFIIYM